jgi:lipopolysaccharide transport system ATP-binding protein
MSRSEIRRKFDEIVAFAGVETFVDTAVKHYSSGMYLRLAFAVAAHLEPEILLVDEVLAVGDAGFQKKCMGKMGDVARDGRTVVLVSHNMAAINRLCRRALWLENGQVRMTGPAESVVAAYLASGAESAGEYLADARSRGSAKNRLRAVRVVGANGRPSGSVDVRQPFCVEIEYEVLTRLPNVRVAFRLLTSDGTVAFISADSADASWEGRPRDPGIYVSRCQVSGLLLNDGQYSITVTSDIPGMEVLFFEERVLSFRVERTGGIGGRHGERWDGVFCPDLSWRVEARGSEASA